MTTTISTSRRSSSSSAQLHVRFSTRADGDFHRLNVPIEELEARRRSFVDLPWTQLDEHHGTTVVRVEAPGAADGASGDIAITRSSGAVLGCWVGDCAPIVLIGDEQEFAVVHAGWRGLATGVIDRAVEAFHEPIERAVLGPVIGPCCYEFGADDARSVANGVHTSSQRIIGLTDEGTRSLDVGATVLAACEYHGIPLDVAGGCTGCSYDGFSHRMRVDPERHVVAAWQTGGVDAR